MMNPSTKDQVEGKFHEVKGAVKEKVGEVTRDPSLTKDGQVEKLAGTIQKKIGQIEKVLEK
ncbi:MAG: CsbD family protein [Bryobacteraceae bacterium]